MKRIRIQSQKHAKVQNLMHFVNAENLKKAHKEQKKNKAKGIDGVGKEEFAENLDANVESIIESMKQMKYKPMPVRRTYIPKANGKLRGLGIPAYADKLVQSVLADILTEIYEPKFLECSKGFRPGKRAHDAVHEIVVDTTTHRVGYIVEADIKGFFDNVDHEWMLKFLRNDIQDEVFIRYIGRFLKAGIMEGTEILDADKGTPQGGLISPILANVYLHYVLDLWIEKRIKPRAKGEIYYVRYADDFIIMTQFKEDAFGILEALKKRLNKFSLEIAEEKTKILRFGRFCKEKSSFDFLGFTFSLGRTRNGKFRTNVRTSKTKLKAKKAALKTWLKDNMHMAMNLLLKKLGRKLAGHNNYYGVSGNYRSVNNFYQFAKYRVYKTLSRRSRKKRITIDVLDKYWPIYIMSPRIAVNIWN